MKNKYQAVIIGAGRIAVGFDTPRSKEVLTHAHAYQLNAKIQLAGIYDIDWSKSRQAARKWSTYAFRDLDKMFAETNPDVVSICTPDQIHYDVLKKILKYRPKLVICEKPLTHQLMLSKQIVQKFANANVPLLVNYSRRFDSAVRKFRAELEKGRYGKVLGAVGIYNKGLLHTGSHLLNLAEFLFGNVTDARALHTLADYQPNDPSVGGWLKFQHCPFFHLAIADSRAYEVFELDIFLEKGRARFTNFGLTVGWQNIQRDSRCPEFLVLGKSKENNTKLNRALMVLADNAVNFLTKKADMFSSAEDALRTQITCAQLSKQLIK